MFRRSEFYAFVVSAKTARQALLPSKDTFVNHFRRYEPLLFAAVLVVFGVLAVTSPFESRMAAAAENGEKQIKYLGHLENKRCHNCHEKQWVSWKKTKHANAMESLEAGTDVGAKEKHDLDPTKDYTEDPKCVKCHVTGWERGGYVIGKMRKMNKLGGVGCETCHGPAGDYQPVKDSYSEDDWPREEVIAAGMKYGELETCTYCHNTDPDNPFPEPDFADDAYWVGIEEAHEHVPLEKHEIRPDSEWLYED